MEHDHVYLRRAMALAVASVESGGFPSGALVVRQGMIVGEGVSRYPKDPDPTAHAEACAIRAAGAGGCGRPTGATLYSLLEPCLMCLHSAYWAGISRIVHGVGKELLRPQYYEGTGSLAAAASLLNRPLVVVRLPGYEARIVELVKNWEQRSGALERSGEWLVNCKGVE